MGAKGSKPLTRRRKPTKLTEDEIEFLKANTSFSEGEIRDWHKGFLQDCPKGELSKKHFINIYKQFFPHGNATEFCEHVFRTFDSDDSGTITYGFSVLLQNLNKNYCMVAFEEFLQAVNITSSGTPEQKLAWAFRMYDVDVNDTIDRSEMESIIKAMLQMLGDQSDDEMAAKRTEMVFKRMDSDNDDKLTKEEFVEGCMKDDKLYQMLTNSKRQYKHRASTSGS